MCQNKLKEYFIWIFLSQVEVLICLKNERLSNCFIGFMKENTLSFSRIISYEEEIIFDFDKAYNYLFFLRKGKIRVEFNQQQSVFDSGEMFFILGRFGSTITLLESLEVIVYASKNQFNLSPFTDEDLKEIQRKGIVTFSGLKMTKPILCYLDLIIFYIEGNLLCEYILEIKEQELFMLFEEFYTKQQCIIFFYPGLCMNIDTPET